MTTFECVRGDITTEDVDAIVNAADPSLLGGRGVDGAIHKAAGPRLLEACRQLRATTLPRGLAPGEAVVTQAFDLPCRWVIHTVGPNRRAGQSDPAVLRSCFTRSVELAAQVGASSLAIPAVGAGAFGWGGAQVAALAWDAVADERRLDLVRFVLFSDELLTTFETARPEDRP